MIKEASELKQRVVAAEDLALNIGKDRQFLEERMLELEEHAAHVKRRALELTQITQTVLAQVNIKQN